MATRRRTKRFSTRSNHFHLTIKMYPTFLLPKEWKENTTIHDAHPLVTEPRLKQNRSQEDTTIHEARPLVKDADSHLKQNPSQESTTIHEAPPLVKDAGPHLKQNRSQESSTTQPAHPPDEPHLKQKRTHVPVGKKLRAVGRWMKTCDFSLVPESESDSDFSSTSFSNASEKPSKSTCSIGEHPQPKPYEKTLLPPVFEYATSAQKNDTDNGQTLPCQAVTPMPNELALEDQPVDHIPGPSAAVPSPLLPNEPMIVRESNDDVNFNFTEGLSNFAPAQKTDTENGLTLPCQTVAPMLNELALEDQPVDRVRINTIEKSQSGVTILGYTPLFPGPSAATPSLWQKGQITVRESNDTGFVPDYNFVAGLPKLSRF